MKTTLTASLLIIVLSSLLAGCGPKPIHMEYSVGADEGDTLYIEWMEAGSNIWESEIVTHRMETTTGTRFAALLLGIYDIDPDDLDSYTPSQQIDSLQVYRFIQMQKDSLIYEGLNDSDWSLNIGNKVNYSYFLKP